MKSSELLRRLLENWPAKVLSVAAAVLLVVFNNVSRLEERSFSVPLGVELPEGLVPASTYPQQVRITLRGEPEEILRIEEEDIRAYVDLTEHTAEGEYEDPVEVEKRGVSLNVEPLEVRVEPESISINLEHQLRKSVEISPTLEGSPPSGYELSQFQLIPETVDIRGPRSRVAPIESVSTDAIELSGRRDNFTVRVTLEELGELLSYPGGNVVEFRGVIDERVILDTFDQVDISVVGLSPPLSVATPLPAGEVRVQASQVRLEEIGSSDVQLVADAGDVDGAGTHELPVRPQVPQGLVVLWYEPTTLTLQIESQGAGNRAEGDESDTDQRDTDQNDTDQENTDEGDIDQDATGGDTSDGVEEGRTDSDQGDSVQDGSG